ncbi:hypothetical protein [Rathayibacter sp. PhB127]|uniref:hypothetical protein n=1 Tax=Rathayibacter sp. PhB127 TaxID=2485176 RepID=UPI0011CE07D3|nr:hypothetical protein [Rathayibacter sp. PhB127]
MPESESPEKVDLLRGWSSQSRLRHTIFAMIGIAFFLGCMFIALLAFSGTERVIVMYPLAGLLLMGAWTLIASFGLPPRAEDEERAGYTALRIGRQHLPMVDDRTGIVLRKAGEPLLDGRTARQRRREARRSS